jgi:hypothetical protein
MWEGTIVEAPAGEAIAFLECLPRRNAEDV